MKIQEADAKTLLVAAGLPVPSWTVARTPADARAAAERYLADGAGRVVIKAQVLVGGRGKAGGVKLAGSPKEAEDVAGRILGIIETVFMVIALAALVLMAMLGVGLDFAGMAD